MAASYVELLRTGELDPRVRGLKELLSPCRVCPRECGTRRTDGETGWCRLGARAGVASDSVHPGEEPPISGTRGSGTIFFSGCNMSCAFCQNYPISQMDHGVVVDAERLAEMMLLLQAKGVHNINWVTPSHVVPQAVEALSIAARRGLRLPIVYNCGGYDGMEALRLLDGIVDVYMPDVKYADDAVAKELSDAPGYVERNRAAIAEMHRQVGDLRLDSDGIAVRGLLVRHLVLPGGRAGTADCMRFLASLSKETYISVMSQYFPANRAVGMPGMKRRITNEEYDEAVQAFHDAGLSNGWIQGG